MDLTSSLSSISSFNAIRSSDSGGNRELLPLSPSLLVPTHYLTLNTTPQQPYRIADMNPYNYNNVVGTQLSVHDPSLQLGTASEATPYAPTTSRRRFVDILNDIRARREQQQAHEEIAMQRQQQQYYSSNNRPVVGRPPMYSVTNASHSFVKPEGMIGLSPSSTCAIVTQHPPPQPLTRTTMVVVPSSVTMAATLPVPFANITECPMIPPIASLPPIHHHRHHNPSDFGGVGNDATPRTRLEKAESGVSTSTSPSKGKCSHDLQTPMPPLLLPIQRDNYETPSTTVSTSLVPPTTDESPAVDTFFKNPTPPASPRHKRAKTSEDCCNDDKEEEEKKSMITTTSTLVDANVPSSASNEAAAISTTTSSPPTGEPVVRLISIQLMPFALADEMPAWNTAWSDDPVYFGDIMSRPSVRARTVIAFLPELPIYPQSPVRQAGGITIEQLRSCFLIRRMRSKPANAASRVRDAHQLAWIERIEVAQYRAHAHAARLCTTPHCRAHFSSHSSAAENNQSHSDLQEHVDTLFAIVFTEAAIRKLCGMRYLLRHFTDGQLFLVERFNE